MIVMRSYRLSCCPALRGGLYEANGSVNAILQGVMLATLLRRSHESGGLRESCFSSPVARDHTPGLQSYLYGDTALDSFTCSSKHHRSSPSQRSLRAAYIAACTAAGETRIARGEDGRLATPPLPSQERLGLGAERPAGAIAAAAPLAAATMPVRSPDASNTTNSEAPSAEAQYQSIRRFLHHIVHQQPKYRKDFMLIEVLSSRPNRRSFLVRHLIDSRLYVVKELFFYIPQSVLQKASGAQQQLQQQQQGQQQVQQGQQQPNKLSGLEVAAEAERVLHEVAMLCTSTAAAFVAAAAAAQPRRGGMSGRGTAAAGIASGAAEEHKQLSVFVQMEYLALSLHRFTQEGKTLHIADVWRLFMQVGDFKLKEGFPSDYAHTAFVAPEVLRGEHFTDKADIYSLGVLFLELWLLCPVVARLTSRDGIRTNFRSCMPPRAVVIAEMLLQEEPHQRPTSLQLLQSGALPPAVDAELFEAFLLRERRLLPLQQQPQQLPQRV
ncbi:protein kinase (incomplete catalytic triad) [Cyclospora cayetanensis]|uniref:Protein kinase (Incomplete catalytic triad) n=1 Tax=Cyclospora cayetanensis TaxID=88456 RepID=A0A1D3D0N8_9EIME|nr:protein kinase (incomplete catalytic triad) [Cyclospora cayetanensis]